MKTYWSPEVEPSGGGDTSVDKVKFTALRVSTIEQVPIYGLRMSISQYDEPSAYLGENRKGTDFNRCSYAGMVVHLCTLDDSQPENWQLEQDGGVAWTSEDDALHHGLKNCYRCSPYCGLQQYDDNSPFFGPRAGRGVLHFNCQQNENLLADTPIDRENCMGPGVDFAGGYTAIETCSAIDTLADCQGGTQWNAKLGRCADEAASATAGLTRFGTIFRSEVKKGMDKKYGKKNKKLRKFWKKKVDIKAHRMNRTTIELDNDVSHPIKGTVIQISPRPVGAGNPEDASEHFFYGFKIFELELMTLPLCTASLLREDCDLSANDPECPSNPCLTEGANECSDTQECIAESLVDSKVELLYLYNNIIN